MSVFYLFSPRFEWFGLHVCKIPLIVPSCSTVVRCYSFSRLSFVTFLSHKLSLYTSTAPFYPRMTPSHHTGAQCKYDGDIATAQITP